MQGLHGLNNFTLFYSEILLLENFFKWLQWDSNPQLELSLAKWLSVCLWTKWLWVRVPFQSFKLQFFLLLKIYFERKLRQDFWKKYVKLVSLRVVEGPIRGYHRAPPSPNPSSKSSVEIDLPKKSLVTVVFSTAFWMFWDFSCNFAWFKGLVYQDQKVILLVRD